MFPELLNVVNAISPFDSFGDLRVLLNLKVCTISLDKFCGKDSGSLYSLFTRYFKLFQSPYHQIGCEKSTFDILSGGQISCKRK